MGIVYEAKKYVDILMKAADPYFQDTEKISPHSGQLKFLKNLMIRQVAISMNIRFDPLRKKEHELPVQKERMKEYLERYILGTKERKKDNRKILEIFDAKKNGEAFLDSVYCEDVLHTEEGMKQEFSGEKILFPPYLLLQAARRAVDEAMCAYVNAGETEVKDAYRDVLMLVAWYEIILRDFGQSLKERMEESRRRVKQADHCGELQQRLNEYLNASANDRAEALSIAQGMAEDTEQYLSAVKQESNIWRIVDYFVCEQTSFYALLRILVLVEWVNIHADHRNSKSRQGELAYEEANYWRDLMEEIREEGSFFAFTGRTKNQAKFYKKYDRFCMDAGLYPILKNEPIEKEKGEKKKQKFQSLAAPFRELFEEYLRTVKLPITKDGKRKEDTLWECEEKLAQPIWKAVEQLSIV